MLWSVALIVLRRRFSSVKGLAMDAVNHHTRLLGLVLLLAGITLTTGCQSVQPPPARIINHRAMIDFSGLTPVQTMAPVSMQGSVPHSWEAVKLKQTSLYTDMQWRSPSRNTAVGIACINMPLPFSNKVLLWFAQREYSKKSNDGRILNEWVDDLGRHWFEAENKQYRVRGYVQTRGLKGWVIYSGYKTAHPPDANELSLATRAIDTIAPMQQASPIESTEEPINGQL